MRHLSIAALSVTLFWDRQHAAMQHFSPIECQILDLVFPGGFQLPAWLMIVFSLHPNLIQKRLYNPLPIDEVLVQPFASCLSDTGHLFVLDPSQSRIFVWDPNGNFKQAFGKRGQGPGELIEPIQIATFANKIFVWQRNGQVSEFTPGGVFLSRFLWNGPWPRRFRLLDDQKALLNYREFNEAGKAYYHFEIRDRADHTTPVKVFHNPGFLEVQPGRNRAEFWAFMADVDIQKDSHNSYWIGFGYQKTLYQLNHLGQIVRDQTFQLSTSKPTQQERDAIENELVDMGNGNMVKVKNLPDMKIHTDVDKAFFTQFFIAGNKVAFVLTDTGGSDGMGDGAAKAAYVVCRISDGAILERGAYQLPEDSQVHYRDGHILVFEINSKDEFDIYEASLKGL